MAIKNTKPTQMPQMPNTNEPNQTNQRGRVMDLYNYLKKIHEKEYACDHYGDMDDFKPKTEYYFSDIIWLSVFNCIFSIWSAFRAINSRIKISSVEAEKTKEQS